GTCANAALQPRGSMTRTCSGGHPFHWRLLENAYIGNRLQKTISSLLLSIGVSRYPWHKRTLRMEDLEGGPSTRREVSKMRSVRCAVCGAWKGEANRWWVLFQADANQTVLIGRIEEAETLQQWTDQTTRFHLCGEECLYRKLNGVIVRGIYGP